MTNFNNLLTERITDGIQRITINRESALNALNKETLEELHQAITAAFADTETAAIILTGAGKKAFVAGADIREFAAFNVEQGTALARDGQAAVFNCIENGNKPVIAAINGYALGGGLELALACHLRIAATTARVGLPEVSLGLIPGYGGTQRLTAIAGKTKAMEMILSGDMISAEEAFQSGIVNRTVAPEDLQEAAIELAKKIIRRAPAAVAAAIKAINAAGSPEGFETEINGFGQCFGTADFREGVAAFLEKREPLFRK